eukprot:TRINITY_DN838_c0_g1_i1.p1 TRINITY_DN838_c0_g1~~TRINITY_DN838_c0_g1_i1.p1  ORF type:complete len:105 (-),score=45.12 TRINITY_DN838_c0_g1_i1:180-494(-)
MMANSSSGEFNSIEIENWNEVEGCEGEAGSGNGVEGVYGEKGMQVLIGMKDKCGADEERQLNKKLIVGVVVGVGGLVIGIVVIAIIVVTVLMYIRQRKGTMFDE